MVEVFSHSGAGYFKLLHDSNSIQIPYGISPDVFEQKVELLPGIGDIDVKTNFVKDLISELTVSASYGKDVIIPSMQSTNFAVGDWIRIGDNSSDTVYSIIRVEDFGLILFIFHLYLLEIRHKMQQYL